MYLSNGGCYLLRADRAATNNFVAIHIGDNEAGWTVVVPLIYLSDDNVFPRLCHLEATESIAFINKEEILTKPREEANKKNLKRLSITFLLFQEKQKSHLNREISIIISLIETIYD